MKNSVLLFLAIGCISVSCIKKEETKVFTFVPSTTALGTISYDSVSYAVINYIDALEINDTTDFYSPDVFSHSETLEFPIQLSLTAEHTYVLKKFDIFDKTGKLKYYIPYQNRAVLTGAIRLPYPFKVSHVNETIIVEKK